VTFITNDNPDPENQCSCNSDPGGLPVRGDPQTALDLISAASAPPEDPLAALADARTLNSANLGPLAGLFPEDASGDPAFSSLPATDPTNTAFSALSAAGPPNTVAPTENLGVLAIPGPDANTSPVSSWQSDTQDNQFAGADPSEAATAGNDSANTQVVTADGGDPGDPAG
jgi:hypothetical protein